MNSVRNNSIKSLLKLRPTFFGFSSEILDDQKQQQQKETKSHKNFLKNNISNNFTNSLYTVWLWCFMTLNLSERTVKIQAQKNCYKVCVTNNSITLCIVFDFKNFFEIWRFLLYSLSIKQSFESLSLT